MGLPRTAVGIIGFMLFTGWLIAMMFTPSDSTLHDTNQNIANTQKDLAEAAKNTASNLSGTDVGWFGNTYGSITGFFQVALNLVILIANFLLVIFASFAAVISTITFLPVEISEILIMLLSIGLIFALLSKVIET